MGDLTALLVAVALLLGNAFFVGAEFAVVSARRTQMEPRAEQGSKAARLTLRAMDRVSLMMAGSQLGITVCSLGLGAVGEPAVAHLLERPFAGLGLPDALLHTVSFAVALTVVVSFHMVLGEMVPKNMVLAAPERAAMLLGPPMYLVVTVVRPLIWALNQAANLTLRLVRVEPQDEVAGSFTAEEVAGLIAESRREGLIDEEQHRLAEGALHFSEEGTGGDIAVPLADLVAVDRQATPADLERLCAETGYSRFPVLDGEDSCGYVHLKDLLGRADVDRHEPLRPEWIRDWVAVDAGDRLRDVLATMQRERMHLVRVHDERQRLVGFATLEDVLEELVGRDHRQDAGAAHSGPVGASEADGR